MRPHPELVFAFGDPHGHLAAVLSAIAACRAYAGGRPSVFVFLGDCIDRGPDSRGVLELLMGWNGPEKLVCLKGNHEDMLLASRADPTGDAGEAWLGNGGAATLHSFGVSHVGRLPRAVTDWIAALPLSWSDGRRFYCHAGVDPTRPLDEQTEAVLMYSRFDYPDGIDLGAYVVHGHTPVGSFPRVGANRANLDTGCGFGGPLSAAAFGPDRSAPEAVIVGGRVFRVPAEAPAILRP